MSGAEYDCKSTAGQRRGHRYRTDVFDEGLTRNDSETMGTRTSVRSGTMDLRELRGERLLMQRLGFVEHVDALDKRIAYFQELQKKEAEARHATYRDRRMRMLHAQHMRRLEDYEVELEANLEATKIECHRREEILAEQHRQQRDEFVERVIRRATNSSDISATACTCTNRYTCQHNKTARYRLRKRNPMVIKYANAARRLRKNRRMGEAMEFEEKATLIENEEKIKWTLQVQNNALQTKLPVMVETHERQSKAMLERHASLQENLALSNSRKLTNLERVLECERSKADTKMSKLKAQDFLQDASAGEVVRAGGKQDNVVRTARASASLVASLAGQDVDTQQAGGVDGLLAKLGIGADFSDLPPITTAWKPPATTGLDNSQSLFTMRPAAATPAAAAAALLAKGGLSSGKVNFA